MYSIITLLVGIAGFLFIMLFGPSNYFQTTIVGKFYNFITEALPDFLSTVLKRILGKTIHDKLGHISNYLCNKSHPILQIFYLTLVTAGIFVFYSFCWERVNSSLFHPVHIILVPFSIGITYVSFAVICKSDPGRITQSNVISLCNHFPYDRVLYHPVICRTCHFQKPARSKHCSLCECCIAKFDHHCAWVNNCIGYNNQRLFIFFLGCTAQLCAYGSYLTNFILIDEYYNQLNVPNLRMLNRDTGVYEELSTLHRLQYLLLYQPATGGLALFCTMIFFVVIGFAFYQLVLAAKGLTTNESFKWDELHYRMSIGNVEVVELTENEVGESTSLLKKPEHVDETEKRVAFKDIVNIYDRGIFNNLMELIFPKGFF